MERRLNLLFGILGGLFLALLSPTLNLTLNLYWSLDVILRLPIVGLVVELFFGILSAIGVLAMAYFSILLIVDGIKTISKKL